MRNGSGKLKLFFYREGEHFTVPEAVTGQCGALRRIPLTPDRENGAYLIVDSPWEADYILFPYVLDQFIMVMRAMAVHFYLRDLPYFHALERRHVFFHCHDRGHPLFTEALILTDSPDRGNRADPFVAALPYYPGAHVLGAAPDFAFERICYDVNFVGAMSSPVRLELLASLAGCEDIRYFARFPKTLDWACSKTSYLHLDDAAKKRRIESIYLTAMRKSWATLCPRGMGASSIRFYETMCLGRIPVHVSDADRLPFEDVIDYAAFTLFIPESEAASAGAILARMLERKGPEGLKQMCRAAREAWESHFKPEDEKALCLKYLLGHLPRSRQPGSPGDRFVPHELSDSPRPRRIKPEGFYADMVVDHKQLARDRGLDVEAGGPGEALLRLNGTPSRLPLDVLVQLSGEAANIPENGTAVLLGAKSGIDAIMLANGLIRGRNFTTAIYSVNEWLGPDRDLPGEGLADFLGHLKRACVGHFTTPLVSRPEGGARRFRPGSVDFFFLSGCASAREACALIASWRMRLKDGARVVLAGLSQEELTRAARELSLLGMVGGEMRLMGQLLAFGHKTPLAVARVPAARPRFVLEPGFALAREYAPGQVFTDPGTLCVIGL